jgi:hypothetical protein
MVIFLTNQLWQHRPSYLSIEPVGRIFSAKIGLKFIVCRISRALNRVCIQPNYGGLVWINGRNEAP